MKIRLLIPLLIITCFGCGKETKADSNKNTNQIVFERQKWLEKGEDYNYREKMIPNLIASDTLKKLNKTGIIQLLGKPDRIDNNHLFYRISQKHIGLLPFQIKTLVIKMSNDSVVEWVKIHG
ncbi:hypothetical protein ABGT15_02960 [Flavobacterium enshiense]|uniref:hypothetical protein n=1 Tax=Flavobacterium enshiense TaxID=1341165 RepID=UPI00345CFD2E